MYCFVRRFCSTLLPSLAPDKILDWFIREREMQSFNAGFVRLRYLDTVATDLDYLEVSFVDPATRTEILGAGL